MVNQQIEILYPDAQDVIEFDDLLKALQHVRDNGKERVFLIKLSPGDKWKDGAKLIRGFQELFAPIEET